MDEATQRELAALADGTLDPTARDALLRRAEESPELADALARQRDALTAIRATAAEPARPELRATIAAMAAAAEDASRETATAAAGEERGPAAEDRGAHDGVAGGRPRRRAGAGRDGSGRRRRLGGAGRERGFGGHRTRRLVALGGGVAALAAAAVILVGGGAGAPSVAEAAQLALAPSRSAAPAARPGTGTLAASVDGVAYPNWAATAGWRAVGSRTDALDGRAVRTVFYANSRGQRIGYAIAAGSPLPAKGGTQAGARYRVLRSGGAAIVTWLRDGHTCILASRGVDASVLLGLARWA